jgi:hypothetical protein
MLVMGMHKKDDVVYVDLNGTTTTHLVLLSTVHKFERLQSLYRGYFTACHLNTYVTLPQHDSGRKYMHTPTKQDRV